MSSARIGSEVSPVRWIWLVPALVAEVLGRHALSPTGTPAGGRHDVMVSLESAGHHSAHAHRVGGDCRHLSHAGTAGVVVDHARGTWAAGGTRTAHVPPALMPALTARLEPAAKACSDRAAGGADGRALPDLSEPRLLRI
ncbi:DUF6153 family protein [Streptomyces sp. NK08204]|uniref:DUF6153 family protein n=1 Tax=Streptomyces sp. NK08204 TaxID=2873260 RepID=UPI001CEC7593